MIYTRTWIKIHNFFPSFRWTENFHISHGTQRPNAGSLYLFAHLWDFLIFVWAIRVSWINNDKHKTKTTEKKSYGSRTAPLQQQQKRNRSWNEWTREKPFFLFSSSVPFDTLLKFMQCKCKVRYAGLYVCLMHRISSRRCWMFFFSFVHLLRSKWTFIVIIIILLVVSLFSTLVFRFGCARVDAGFMQLDKFAEKTANWKNGNTDWERKREAARKKTSFYYLLL